MISARLQAIHSTVGRGPKVVSGFQTEGVCGIRFFVGSGSPSSSNLVAGNYNATNGGNVVNVSLYVPGTGYSVGDVLTVTGGMSITVDSVLSGVITGFHLTAKGSYTTPYPTANQSASGGTGAGAQFTLNFPPPDFYIDISTPASPVVYVCINEGTSMSSVWSQIGAVGMILRGEYNPATAYAVGDCVVIRSGANAGFYACVAANTGQSPQMPDTGNGYWLNLNGNAPTMGQWL